MVPTLFNVSSIVSSLIFWIVAVQCRRKGYDEGWRDYEQAKAHARTGKEPRHWAAKVPEGEWIHIAATSGCVVDSGLCYIAAGGHMTFAWVDKGAVAAIDEALDRVQKQRAAVKGSSN